PRLDRPRGRFVSRGGSVSEGRRRLHTDEGLAGGIAHHAAQDHPVSLDSRERGGGDLAPSAQRGKESALRDDARPRRWVVKRLERPLHPPLLVPGLDRERSLPHGRQAEVHRERDARAVHQAETVQSRGREDDRVEISLAHLSQSRPHVAADRNVGEVRADVSELRDAPRAPRSDARAGAESFERQAPARGDDVSRILPCGDRRDPEARRYLGGEILERVHSGIDASRGQGLLDLPHEDPLAGGWNLRPRNPPLPPIPPPLFYLPFPPHTLL